MPTITIKELVDEITDEQMEKNARVEGLIKLREGLQRDRYALIEIAGEVIEQRREHVVNLDLDMGPIDAAMKALLAAFTDLEKAAHKEQLTTFKN